MQLLGAVPPCAQLPFPNSPIGCPGIPFQFPPTAMLRAMSHVAFSGALLDHLVWLVSTYDPASFPSTKNWNFTPLDTGAIVTDQVCHPGDNVGFSKYVVFLYVFFCPAKCNVDVVRPGTCAWKYSIMSTSAPLAAVDPFRWRNQNAGHVACP